MKRRGAYAVIGPGLPVDGDPINEIFDRRTSAARTIAGELTSFCADWALLGISFVHRAAIETWYGCRLFLNKASRDDRRQQRPAATHVHGRNLAAVIRHHGNFCWLPQYGVIVICVLDRRRAHWCRQLRDRQHARFCMSRRDIKRMAHLFAANGAGVS